MMQRIKTESRFSYREARIAYERGELDLSEDLPISIDGAAYRDPLVVEDLLSDANRDW